MNQRKMDKTIKADAYVLIGEAQFYNLLKCPWSATVVREESKNIQLENISLMWGIQYIYLSVENMYKLEVTAGQNILARSMFPGIISQTFLVATRKKTRVSDSLLGVDSLQNKTENNCKMLVVQQMKRIVIKYLKDSHARQQIWAQIESKTNNLAKKEVLLLLQYLSKASDISKAKRFMPVSFRANITERMRIKFTKKCIRFVKLDSSSLYNLYPILKRMHSTFGLKFISYSFHELVLGVTKENLIRQLQKLKDLAFESYCNLPCIKGLHFFMKFNRHLHDDYIFKMINKSLVKADMKHFTSFSKTRNSELHDCFKLLWEAPKYVCPRSVLCKKYCIDEKDTSFKEFESTTLNDCVERPEKLLQKSIPFRTSSYCIPANFAFLETCKLEGKQKSDKNILLNTEHKKKERISEHICDMLCCQSVSFTRWHMKECMTDKIRINCYEVRNLKVTSTFPLIQDNVIVADSEPYLVTWSDIGGLDAVKKVIRTAIQLPTMYDELFQSHNKGLILYGPPGTGKTLLARAISNECQLKFFMIKGPEIIDMYVGESERHMRQIFLEAKEAAPSILFFDELDALASKRVDNESMNSTSRVVSQLILEIDDLSNFQNVFIMGATNRPDRIDVALLRPGRFDRLIYVGVDPTVEGKGQIMKSLTRRMKLAPEIDFHSLAETHASRYSGADLYSVCASSWLRASKRHMQGKERCSDPDVVVKMEDFISSFAELKPSLSKELIEYYEDLNSSFSEITFA
jgi:ATP-dependent 26S proteasome regulatory subunit